MPNEQTLNLSFEPVPTSDRQPYQTPMLEQHHCYVVVTGTSLGIGAVSSPFEGDFQ